MKIVYQLLLALLLLQNGCSRLDKHEQVKKFCQGGVYTFQNSHGKFSVCLQKSLDYDEIGIASFYSTGKITATMEPFNPNHFTAAHPYLPMPCVVEVSLASDPHRKIILRINDRGPLTKQRRIIDLSYRAAHELGFITQGLAKVRVRVLVKETKLLKERGGPLNWKGEIPFEIAMSKLRQQQASLKQKVKSAKSNPSKNRLQK